MCWKVIFGIILEISSPDHLTCSLRQDRDGVWKGRWIRFEKNARSAIATISIIRQVLPRKINNSMVLTNSNVTIDEKTEWSPDHISVVIMAVRRSTDYLSKTILSLSLADSCVETLKEIAIAVDDTDVSWILSMPFKKKIAIMPLSDGENSRVKEYKLHRRACHNYYRALQLAKCYRGLIVCEDDVVFRNGWIEKLCCALNEMQQDSIKDFVLSLTPHTIMRLIASAGAPIIAAIFASSFYGTQCVFYCASQVGEISRRVWRHGVQIYRAPYDLLLKRHCELKQNLYTTRVSLNQHIGRNSTGLGSGNHRSPTFHLPWPDAH